MSEIEPRTVRVLRLFTTASSRTTARIAGGLYLAYILTTVLVSYLQSTLLSGDASATAQNLLAHATTVRLAFVTELASAALFFFAAWALYTLLRPVHENYALLFLLLNLGGVVVQCANALNFFAAFQVLTDSNLASAFSAGQVQALAVHDIGLYRNGFMIAQVFFGTWLLPLGYLVYRSGFLPRFLGALLMVDFAADLFWFGQCFLLPSDPALSYPANAIGFVAEFGLALWLILMSVKLDLPRSTPMQGARGSGA